MEAGIINANAENLVLRRTCPCGQRFLVAVLISVVEVAPAWKQALLTQMLKTLGLRRKATLLLCGRGNSA